MTRPHKFTPGQAVRVCIRGLVVGKTPQWFAGRIVSERPLRAEITQQDKIWRGAVVTNSTAHIRRLSA